MWSISTSRKIKMHVDREINLTLLDSPGDEMNIDSDYRMYNQSTSSKTTSHLSIQYFEVMVINGGDY